VLCTLYFLVIRLTARSSTSAPGAEV